jgi:DNA-binding response OmpR family regulator
VSQFKAYSSTHLTCRISAFLCLLDVRTRASIEITYVDMLRFGNVALDMSRGSLRGGDGAEVALRPKSLDLLLALARNPGRVMSRDDAG